MNLIVYGSLLNKNELHKHNISMDNVVFVKVKGFRRVFNQEPSWRKVASRNRAVMNVEKKENAWFNALLIKDLTQSYIEELDERERGYDRHTLPQENVHTYDGKNISNCIVYVGKEGKQSRCILPNKEYFDICLQGAKSHFKEFGEDYASTTYFYDENEVLQLINKNS